ncbi:MAG: DEAD/DEAH box helicase [Phycisphaerales bacterium]|nr:DEAD/DEAH box helicase [Phycisphaerales bacterium]
MGDQERGGGGSGGRRGGKKRGGAKGSSKGRGKGGGRGPRRKDAPEPTRQRTISEPEGGWSDESFCLDKTFADLGLSDDILKAMDELGFKHPTKIQAELVPLALTEVDILGQAKTGTGKTAAFALPLLELIEPGDSMCAIILAPTRELAVQIKQDIEELAPHTGLSVCAIYGGQSINVQAEQLRKHPEIIVGTPGRVLDMIERGFLSLSQIEFAVLDEVDRMLDIGFRDDIRKILGKCPKDRQTIFVSATFTDEIEKLARKFMQDPVKLEVSSGALTVDLVKQGYVTVEPWDKRRMLAHVLTHEEPALTIVFCRMKRTVDSVVRYLERKGISAHAIHGDLTQSKRNSVMTKFRSGDLAVLVASDLASRGIDVEGITHVVNYDLPEDPDIYVHRIGRTARAGRNGHAWSLVTPAQGALLTDIELLVNAEIPAMKYPDFEARERPEDWKDEPTGGRPTYEVKGVKKEAKNRFAEEAPPAEKELSDAEKAEKFPGGVVPAKRPPRALRGKTRTRGR